MEEMEDVVGLDSNDLKEIGLNMAQRNRVVNSPPGPCVPFCSTRVFLYDAKLRSDLPRS